MGHLAKTHVIWSTYIQMAKKMPKDFSNKRFQK